jgi:hypothetical protein
VAASFQPRDLAGKDAGAPRQGRATCWSDMIANQFLLTTSKRLKLLDEVGK